MKQNIIRQRRQAGFAALLISTSLVSTLPLAAQDFGAFECVESSTVQGGFRVSASGAYRAETDIDGGGEFDEARFSVVGLGIIKVSEQWTFNPVLSYRFSAYDFSSADLWDDIHTLRTTPLVQYNLDDRWTLFGGPSIGFAAESDADIGTSFTFGALVGVKYKINPTLTVGAGLGVFSQIEDDATILPLPILNWQISDAWSLRAGYSEVAAAGGLGAEVEWKFHENWSVGGGLQFQKKRFRLSDETGAPAREGVGEDSSVPVYGKITWHASKHASVELVAGVSAGGELRLEDDDGHKLAEEDYDPSGLFGLRVLFSF